MERFLSLLSDPHRWSMAQAFRIAHRGWLIERARSKKLRDERDEAREIAEELESMMDEPQAMPWQASETIFSASSRHSLLSQARRLAESYRLGMIGLGMRCQKLPWQADQAAKGGE